MSVNYYIIIILYDMIMMLGWDLEGWDGIGWDSMGEWITSRITWREKREGRKSGKYEAGERERME